MAVVNSSTCPATLLFLLLCLVYNVFWYSHFTIGGHLNWRNACLCINCSPALEESTSSRASLVKAFGTPIRVRFVLSTCPLLCRHSAVVGASETSRRCYKAHPTVGIPIQHLDHSAQFRVLLVGKSCNWIIPKWSFQCLVNFKGFCLNCFRIVVYHKQNLPVGLG